MADYPGEAPLLLFTLDEEKAARRENARRLLAARGKTYHPRAFEYQENFKDVGLFSVNKLVTYFQLDIYNVECRLPVKKLKSMDRMEVGYCSASRMNYSSIACAN
jgi:hypothetical protein